jgi:hypothetical protein
MTMIKILPFPFCPRFTLPGMMPQRKRSRVGTRVHGCIAGRMMGTRAGRTYDRMEP